MERPTEVQRFPEFLEQADWWTFCPAALLDDVDTFKVKSQLIYFGHQNS
jgi:hypothetical protein